MRQGRARGIALAWKLMHFGTCLLAAWPIEPDDLGGPVAGQAGDGDAGIHELGAGPHTVQSRPLLKCQGVGRAPVQSLEFDDPGIAIHRQDGRLEQEDRAFVDARVEVLEAVPIGAVSHGRMW